MASYTGYIKVKADMPNTVLQKKLFDLIGNKEVMRKTHQILGEMCNDYVPYDPDSNHKGLRESMHAYPNSVKWETPYAHYQYVGKVYETNRPISKDGFITAWYSTPGTTKIPTSRRLGTPGTYKGWKFGYKTPGTGDHWYDAAMKNGGRRTFSLRVTNMLKAEARRRNKTW